jgi:hypothetical protein
MRLPIWWKAWGELVQKFVALAASFASLVAVLVTFVPSPRDLPLWAVVVLVFAAFCLVVLVVLEFIDRPSSPNLCQERCGRNQEVHARLD